MMRVVALNAPASKVAERRFRSRFTSATQLRVPQDQEVDNVEDEIEGERAVTLCMELVHREGCAVAEEANEILRQGGLFCSVAAVFVFCPFLLLSCLVVR